MKNDYGPDSGLFLRSTERGQAYQALIDYHGGGSLMGIYGEGGIALQVHGGGDFTKQFVRYRKVRVKELD